MPPRATEVFSLDSKLKAHVDGMPTSDFSLKSDGRWSYVEEVDGKITKRASGAIAMTKVAEIKRALAGAKWTFTMAQFRCMAESITYSEVSVRGGVVWTTEVCSGKILDANSRKALDRVMTIVTPLIASTVK